MPLARILFPVLVAAACACSEGGQPASGAEPAPAAVPSSAARQARARGAELYQAERPLEAVAALEEAVALAPDWAEARLELGKLLFSLSPVRFGTAMVDHDRLDAAIEQLARARALQPGNPEAAYWAGRALSLAQRNREAQEMYETALALVPGQGTNHARFGGWSCKELGLLFESEGDVGRAKAFLARARELLPEDDEVLFHLALQLENEDDLAGALELHLEAVELNPAHPGPRTRLVALYQRLDREADARRASEELARCKEFGRRLTAAMQKSQEDARDAAAMLGVAELYLELDMLDSARSWTERALRIEPEHAAARGLLEQIEELEKRKRPILIAPEEESAAGEQGDGR